jgi:hypothetical protein
VPAEYLAPLPRLQPTCIDIRQPKTLGILPTTPTSRTGVKKKNEK